MQEEIITENTDTTELENSNLVQSENQKDAVASQTTETNAADNSDTAKLSSNSEEVSTESETRTDKKDKKSSAKKGLQNQDTKEAPTQAPKKKKNPIMSFFKIIFGIVLGGLLVSIIWVGYSTFARDSIEEHVPENLSLYATVPSASKLISETLELQALDELFADESMADIYSLIKMLRSNDLLSSKLFSFLADIRLDAAIYTKPNEENNKISEFEIYAFGDLGFRSSVTRLIPLALKLKPNLVYDLEINELETHKDEHGLFFSFELSENSFVVFRFYKNLFLAKLHNGSIDNVEFTKLISKNSERFRRTLQKDLQQNKSGTLNILADFNQSKNLFASSNSILETVLKEISFPERSNINIQLKNESIKVSGDLKLKTDHPELGNILNTKGSVPKIYNRLPETCEYFTLLNFQTPEELLKNLDEFLPTDIKNTYKSANSLVKTLLGGTIDDIILPWFGEEIGVFAVDGVDAPIFFTSIRNKQECLAFFNKLFSSILIDQNSSTVVDDIRISRIVFPPLINALLKLFKIDLPTPFYFIDGDFVFFSESSEGIARYKQAYNDSKVITKNEKWKSMLQQISSETSFVLYYDVERSVPFFLANNKTLSNLLSHYGTGLLSFRLLGNQSSNLSFYAVKKESVPLRRLATFPKQMEGKLFGDLHQSKTKSGASLLFWSIGERIFSFDLTNDKVKSIKVDSNALLTVQEQESRFKALWAVTKNGTVYRLNENLDSQRPFPVLTSIKSIGEPVVFKNQLVFSAQDDPQLIFVTEQGDVSYSTHMHTTMKGSPTAHSEVIAALPRSFDSTVYFFGSDGVETFAPIELESITAIKPIIFEQGKKQILVANITEDGFFTLDNLNDNDDARRITSQELNFSCICQPKYAETLNAILAIDTDGILHVLKTDGTEKNSTKLAYKDSNMSITLKDITNDGIDEIFVSGGGNAIYAYTSNLALIDGFPISGASNPVFADVNADGTNDIITFGIDSKLYAFEGLVK